MKRIKLINVYALVTLILLCTWAATAGAGNAWLDANGIRIDNVALNGTAVSNGTYWLDPPFLNAQVRPNVLIVLDNSGSMNDQAYSGNFDPTQFVSGHYFGYFDPTKMYRYQGGVWSETAADPATTATVANPIANGDFLNWAYMTKVEATKMLLIGGRANPRTVAGCCVNRIGETSSYTFHKNYDNSTNPAADKKIYPFNGDYEYERTGGGANGLLNVTPLTGPSSATTAVNGDISVPASWVVAGAASAWQAVLTNDGNTSTISNTTSNFVPALFSYNYAGPTTDPITSITIRVVARRISNATTRRIQGVLRISGVDYASTNSSLSTSYQTYNFAWNNNPATGNPWLWTEINAALQAFGVQAYTLPTGANYPVVTQISMVVTMSPPEGGPYSFTVNTNATSISGIVDSLSNDVRFGLGYYNNSSQGGHIDTYVNFGAPASMITSINDMVPSTWTPLAETLYEMMRYFRQEAPYYANTPADFQTGLNTLRDPYYYTYSTLPGSGLADQYVPCAKSFILFLTDGEPTQDQSIPGWLQDFDGDSNDPIPDNTRYPSNGSDFFDDVAYWARTTDHRTLAGTQNVVLYPVFMFGKGSNLLQRAAVKGGFDDTDSNNFPSCWDMVTNKPKVGATQNELKECYRDSNGNGTIDPFDPATNQNGDLPLTYYQGDDGYELQTSITEALTEILKRAASGTSVSVLGSSWKGEGAIYQAYFYPEKIEALRHVKWTGYFKSLFVDRQGLVHEDTNNDGVLKSQDDAVVEFEYVPGTGTIVKYFWDRVDNTTGESKPDGIKDSPTPFNTVMIDELKPVWDAGKMLASRSPSDRTIYTSIDAGSIAAIPSLIDFNYDSGSGTDNSALLRPFLRAKTSASAANIIKFVRGEVVTGWRDRQLTVDGTERTWKLGDIVFSDPLVIPAPKERFDLLYGSKSAGYNEFYNRWKNRRAMIYVGANDGMLHAFNSGFSESANPSQEVLNTTAQVTMHTAVSLDANYDVSSYGSDASKPLGKELWALVPYDVLPHLAWLTDPDYQHVFYVDLAVRATDANIFPPDADHVNGWGTILLVGMRFGGGEIDVEDDFGTGNEKRAFKSAYYALDVTNPEVPPKLLWRFTDDELGFTLSWPMVVHQMPDKWYVVFGSGPSNFRGGRVVDTINTNVKFTKSGVVAGLGGMSSTNPYLYVLDLATGKPLPAWTAHPTTGIKGLIKLSTVQTNAFTAAPAVADYPLDFNYDMIYAGTTYCSAGCAPDGSGTWSGSVRRIDLRDAATRMPLTDPGLWRASRLFSSPGPVSTKPSIGLDPAGKTWVYFGTGRFLHIDDRFDNSQQRFYGMKDTCYASGCQTLMDGTNFLNSTSYTLGAGGALVPTIAANTLTPPNTSLIDSYRGLAAYMQDTGTGWYLNLSLGERVTVNGFVLGGIAGFGTYTPNSDVCEYEGSAKQWVPSYLTGTSVYSPTGTGLVVPRDITVGPGLPSAPAVHFDSKGNARLFIVPSTGSITRIDLPSPAPGGFGSGGECLQ